MSFSENLQILRKRANLTQDDLAFKLDVTRQAVSKWESGSGYPEMEKIILLCDLFGCDMDTLVKGEIADENKEARAYEKTMNAVSTAFALAVAVILLGFTALVLITGFTKNTENEQIYAIIGAAVLIASAAISTPVFIVYGLKLADFRRKHPALQSFYSDDEISSFYTKFGIGIGVGVAVIILGVAAAILTEALTQLNEALIAAIIIGPTAIAAPLFVFFGIRMGKYSAPTGKRYNKGNITSKICSVIMLTAAAIFFITGVILQAWSKAWVVFPLGGIICAIVSVVFRSRNR